jgi:hypothetical protein
LTSYQAPIIKQGSLTTFRIITTGFSTLKAVLAVLLYTVITGPVYTSSRADPAIIFAVRGCTSATATTTAVITTLLVHAVGLAIRACAIFAALFTLLNHFTLIATAIKPTNRITTAILCEFWDTLTDPILTSLSGTAVATCTIATIVAAFLAIAVRNADAIIGGYICVIHVCLTIVTIIRRVWFYRVIFGSNPIRPVVIAWQFLVIKPRAPNRRTSDDQQKSKKRRQPQHNPSKHHPGIRVAREIAHRDYFIHFSMEYEIIMQFSDFLGAGAGRRGRRLEQGEGAGTVDLRWF